MKKLCIKRKQSIGRIGSVMFFACWLIGSMSEPAAGQKSTPLAEWNFDEGHGAVTHDATGNGHTAKILGATWVKQDDGFALRLDGLDDYIELSATKKLAFTGPVTIEAWIKPEVKSQGLAALFGGSLTSYFVAYYTHAELVYWFIGSGGNKVAAHVNLREWNHIAATFDGHRMELWINGRLAQKPYRSKESKFKTYKTDGSMIAGTKGRPDLPRFRGMMDKVRIYDHALSGAQAVAHYKNEAPAYGIDPAWFRRAKVTGYEYLDRGEVLLEINYKGLQPLAGEAQIGVGLSNKQRPDQLIQWQLIESVPDVGVVEAKFSCDELSAGDYVVRVAMEDDDGAHPVEEFEFSYPAQPPRVASPEDQTAGPLPPASRPGPFELTMGQAGGFTLRINEESYRFQSRISWPNGDFNHLTADGAAVGGEAAWRVAIAQQVSPFDSAQGKQSQRYKVEAGGDFYTIHRQIDVFATHVYVKDTYTNTGDEDLGLLIYNEMPINRDRFVESRLGGWERGGRPETAFSPSVFVADKNTGIGIIPIDDVYVVQSVLYAESDVSGVGTEKFALAPGKSYTLEWAVYPTHSGDYYDFINSFRKVENRIGSIDGGVGIYTYSPTSRRQIPSKELIEKQGLKYGAIHGLGGNLDDPQVGIQGIEFMDFPKERAMLRKQAAAIHKRYPGFRPVFHIAHSLYATNNPDRFADSKVIGKNGEQKIWGVPYGWISKERQDAGWKYWIFYPTPGNSFHDAMMKSVDVLMDEIGMDGGFFDGFFVGYGSKWNYDGRWDGHSAEIDPNTKTITRKIGSVLLLSQPSMIEFCRKIRDKGGVVIANNTVVTRSIANEKYIIHDSESGAGPQLHLAPTITALGGGETEKEVYLDTLEKLSWGELFVPYSVPRSIGHELTHPLLSAREFPMTFEEIRSGMVRGKQRIVTMNSGVYGWPEDRLLHRVYKFDARGQQPAHSFFTTVDSDGVRTELEFGKNESAVIEPIPVTLEASAPVNLRVLEFDDQQGDVQVKILLHGQGEATLDVFVGGSYFPGNNNYRVTIGGQTTTIAEDDGTLKIPLSLDGQVEVVIESAGEEN